MDFATYMATPRVRIAAVALRENHLPCALRALNAGAAWEEVCRLAGREIDRFDVTPDEADDLRVEVRLATWNLMGYEWCSAHPSFRHE